MMKGRRPRDNLIQFLNESELKVSQQQVKDILYQNAVQNGDYIKIREIVREQLINNLL